MKRTTIQLIISAVLIIFSCSAINAQLTLQESSSHISLGNQEIVLTIEKAKARIVHLQYKEQDLISPGQSGYFTLIGANLGDDYEIFPFGNCEYRVHLQNEHTIDLAFTPLSSPVFPFDVELHLVLRKGDSGFYFYMVTGKGADTPDARIVQFRFGIRLEHSFLNIRVNDERFGKVLSPGEILDAQGKVMDATYLLESGEHRTKYEWSSPTGEAPVYGLHNGSSGIWMIRGGSDYLNGGPTKQHNTCHGTDKGPIVLNLLYSSHYGSSGSYVSGEWEKVFGPTFVYLNQADSAEELWSDAKNQEESIRKLWPYSWVLQSGYPVDRAEISGYFPNTDTGWVVLARPKEYRGLDWQQQGGDSYIYRSRIYKDGSFVIPAVRDGSYTLYAFSPGIVGEYRMDNIEVTSSQDVYLGLLSWDQRTNGSLMWRIGYPDRTAAEYKHGDDFRHWGLWYSYLDDFPDDVDFIIGESDESTDWNYAQMDMWIEEGGWAAKLDANTGEGYWEDPVWKIRFNNEEAMSDTAMLTLALAGVSREGGLDVTLNGEVLASFENLIGDGCVHRSGIQGLFRERFIKFDASRIQLGENEITLSYRMYGQPKVRTNYSFGVMYDFIQLEVPQDTMVIGSVQGIRKPLVHPTLSDGILIIELPGLQQNGELRISAISGRPILHQVLNEKSNRIELGDVPTGLYIVVVGTGGQSYYHKVFLR